MGAMQHGGRSTHHAQTSPTFTSTADHIRDREAFQANSGLSPKTAIESLDEVGEVVMACWR